MKEFIHLEAFHNKKLEYNLVGSKDKVIDVADKTFERPKAQVTHLYTGLDLINLCLFKILLDALIVDEEYDSEQEVVPSLEEENINTLNTTFVNEEGLVHGEDESTLSNSQTFTFLL